MITWGYAYLPVFYKNHTRTEVRNYDLGQTYKCYVLDKTEAAHNQLWTFLYDQMAYILCTCFFGLGAKVILPW